MVDVSDVQGYSDKYDNQLDKLESAPIDEDDRSAIGRFVRDLDAADDIGTGTIIGHLNRLRLSAERADVPLTEMDLEDVRDYLYDCKHEHDLAEGTRRNYRKAIRKFAEWLERDWWEEVSIGAAPSRSVDPNELLEMEEIEALIDAADHTRDKALVAMISDAGLRISAVTSLRKRDFEYREGGAVVHPNTDGPVKGATDPVPLTWSAGYVANWLDVHPRDDPDAALFHKLEHIEDGEDGALRYQYAARRIKRIADDAGIDRERVRTHNFRKSAISRWIREGLPEQVIKHRASWVKDSGQFEIYSGVTAGELNDQIFGHYGLETAEDLRPSVDRCKQCRTPLPDGVALCPGCATPQTPGAREIVDDARERTRDDVGTAAESGDADAASVAHAIDRALADYPDARDALVSELGHGDPSEST